MPFERIHALKGAPNALTLNWARVDQIYPYPPRTELMGRELAGKRLGPAEVESILNAHPAVMESAAIGVPHPVKDNEVVVFCVLAAGNAPNASLRAELEALVAAELGRPLKPREIKFCTSLPKTRNAKVMRRLIRAAYLGIDLGDVSSLEDPSTVDAIRHAV